VRTPEDVLGAAANVPGMIPFFSLLGGAITGGRSRLALDLLVALGLTQPRAWALVEGWERMLEQETATGWTAEVVAMGFVMNDVEGWWARPYDVLLKGFRGTAAEAGPKDPRG
jgi:hypothetical protein